MTLRITAGDICQIVFTLAGYYSKILIDGDGPVVCSFISSAYGRDRSAAVSTAFRSHFAVIDDNISAFSAFTAAYARRRYISLSVYNASVDNDISRVTEIGAVIAHAVTADSRVRIRGDGIELSGSFALSVNCQGIDYIIIAGTVNADLYALLRVQGSTVHEDQMRRVDDIDPAAERFIPVESHIPIDDIPSSIQHTAFFPDGAYIEKCIIRACLFNQLPVFPIHVLNRLLLLRVRRAPHQKHKQYQNSENSQTIKSS